MINKQNNTIKNAITQLFPNGDEKIEIDSLKKLKGSLDEMDGHGLDLALRTVGRDLCPQAVVCQSGRRRLPFLLCRWRPRKSHRSGNVEEAVKTMAPKQQRRRILLRRRVFILLSSINFSTDTANRSFKRECRSRRAQHRREDQRQRHDDQCQCLHLHGAESVGHGAGRADKPVEHGAGRVDN